jgi:hypothetical protein
MIEKKKMRANVSKYSILAEGLVEQLGGTLGEEVTYR